MKDPRLDRYVASLDAAFDAALAREEDAAASDLAFSLVQDRTLLERVERRGGVLLLGRDRREAVTCVGRDYFGGGAPVEVVVPADRATVVLDGRRGRPPAVASGTLLELLRAWARSGAVVTAETASGSWTGRLEAAGRDHVVVRDRAGGVAIPLGALLSVARRAR